MIENDLEGGGGSALVGSLIRLLPLLLIMMLVAGIGMFGATLLLPQWRDYEQLSAERDAAQQSLDDLNGQQSQDPITVLQAQVERASAQLNEAASAFVSPLEADGILDRLYGYARESEVEIVSLEALAPETNARGSRNQPTPAPATASAQRMFRLQVVGGVRALMDFVVRVREASIPGVMMSHLAMSQQDEQTSLLLDLTIYTSPFASGQVFADLPAPGLLPTPTPLPPTPTQTTTPQSTPQGEAVMAATPAADAVPALPECPGAPVTSFAVGDTAVVDFNGGGALRILAGVGPGINVLAQAYDNQVLMLVDGPACGQWHEHNLWYWYVDNFNGTRGWVGEGPAGDRWLCPMSEPECA
jgi:hypothetical protein